MPAMCCVERSSPNTTMRAISGRSAMIRLRFRTRQNRSIGNTVSTPLRAMASRTMTSPGLVTAACQRTGLGSPAA